MNWPKIRLDECARIVSGATPSTSVPSYWDGEIAWATPKDLSELDTPFIGSTPRTITEAGLSSCAAEVLPPHSVLLSSRAPIGHVAINTIPMATNQGFKSFVPDPKLLDGAYLYWWLRANRAYLQGLGNGATFKEISKAIVERIEILLPPLGEQRRIGAILDQADALRRKRRVSLDLLGRLRLRTVLSVLTETTRSFALEQIAKVDWGNTSITKKSYQPEGYTAYSATGPDGRLSWFEHDGPGIVLSAIGAQCGKCFSASGKWTAIKNTITITEFDERVVAAEYLFVLINQESYWRRRGAGQPFISVGDARRSRVALPSIEIQRSLTRKMQLADLHLTKMSEQENAFDALFKSLQGFSFLVTPPV